MGRGFLSIKYHLSSERIFLETKHPYYHQTQPRIQTNPFTTASVPKHVKVI